MNNRVLAKDLYSLFMNVKPWTKEAFNQISEQSGSIILTLPQYKVLSLIKQYQPCKMSDISGLAKVSLASLTSMIDRLEEEETVERILSKEDRRIVILKLTEKGEDFLNKTEESAIDFVENKINGLDVEKQKVIEQSIVYINELFNMP